MSLSAEKNVAAELRAGLPDNSTVTSMEKANCTQENCGVVKSHHDQHDVLLLVGLHVCMYVCMIMDISE